MQYRELGKSGLRVTPMTVGSWEAGGGKEWGIAKPDEVYIDMMRCALDRGINFIDSAVFYGHGHAEELIGKAIKGYDREKIVISTKQIAGLLKHENARQTVEECLKRLDTDYIDVFLVHWPNPEVEIEENMEELTKLKEAGLIRAIGVSNYTIRHLERAVKAAQVDVIQPCYSLFWRHQLEKDILPFCIEHNIGVMTYSSIGQGILSDRFLHGKFLDEGDQRNNVIPLFSDEVFPAAIEAAKKIRAIGAKYEKTLAQTAINWVYNTPGITTAIVGACTRTEYEENLGALDWELSPEDRKAIGDIGMEIADMVGDWDTLFGKDHPMLKLK
ncbi:MAG: aldo/keto reductase [Oscillospiraceae bacterium]|nr:aldo/keto reductase [Oscillospiraceae bacterium]